MVDYYIACDIIYKFVMLQAFKQFLSDKERIPEKINHETHLGGFLFRLF